MNHTLHGVLHHSSMLIRENQGYGLGSLSEEGLEANNKDIRNYIQFLSRKCSPFDQLTDVMSRLLLRSHPEIYAIANKRAKFCKHCGSTDHNIRSHERVVLLAKQQYDSFVEQFIVE